jgi:hypothetical protein
MFFCVCIMKSSVLKIQDVIKSIILNVDRSAFYKSSKMLVSTSCFLVVLSFVSSSLRAENVHMTQVFVLPIEPSMFNWTLHGNKLLKFCLVNKNIWAKSIGAIRANRQPAWLVSLPRLHTCTLAGVKQKKLCLVLWY